MRILVIAIGSDGDINPMLEISKELKSRGHEIVFFANGYFKEKVEKEGFQLVELGASNLYHETIKNPELWSPRKGFQAIWEVMKPYLLEQYELLKEWIIPGETAVVGTTLAFPARFIQEKHRLKLTTVHLQPSFILSAENPPCMPGLKLSTKVPLFMRKWLMQVIDEQFLDRVLKDDINKVRNEIGLPPVKNVMRSWIHSPDSVLLAFPEWYSTPQADWPENHEFAGFPVFLNTADKQITEKTREFIEADEPPLVFTAGSANAHSRIFFDTAINTLKQLKKRAIFVSKFEALEELKLPDSIHVSSYEPFDLLFPKTLAVVHHGGVGTTAQCLWAGVPQMIAPFAHDQFDNAYRIEELKTGLYARTLKVDEWVEKLNFLIEDPVYKENSQYRSGLMQTEERAASRAAAIIEKLGV